MLNKPSLIYLKPNTAQEISISLVYGEETQSLPRTLIFLSGTLTVWVSLGTEVAVHPRFHNKSFLRLLTNVNWHVDQVVSPATVLES